MAEDSRHLADFFVAGMRYWDGALVVSDLKPGKKLRLMAETDNAYDHNAVAIWRKKTKLGYIPADENALAAQLLRFGHGDVIECRVLSVDPTADPWKQVRAGLFITDARKDAQTQE